MSPSLSLSLSHTHIQSILLFVTHILWPLFLSLSLPLIFFCFSFTQKWIWRQSGSLLWSSINWSQPHLLTAWAARRSRPLTQPPQRDHSYNHSWYLGRVCVCGRLWSSWKVWPHVEQVLIETARLDPRYKLKHCTNLPPKAYYWPLVALSSLDVFTICS